MKALLLMILAICVLGACQNALQEEDRSVLYEEEYAETVELSGQTKLILQNTNGAIDIAGSDVVNDMHLEITKWVRSHSMRDAQDHIDDIVITDERRPQEVYIKVEHPSTDDRSYGVDFVITVPTQFDFEISCGNGQISVSSIIGNSAFALGNGEIDLDEVEATQIIAVLGNGNTDVDVILMDTCLVDLGVGNGNITLRIPGSTNAEVEASVGNGEITRAGLNFQPLHESPGHLEGTLGDGSGNIILHVGNGGIDLRGK